MEFLADLNDLARKNDWVISKILFISQMLNLWDVKVGERQRGHLHKLFLINKKFGFTRAPQIRLLFLFPATGSDLVTWTTASWPTPWPSNPGPHTDTSTPSTAQPGWAPQRVNLCTVTPLTDSLWWIPAAFRLDLECLSGPKSGKKGA